MTTKPNVVEKQDCDWCTCKERSLIKDKMVVGYKRVYGSIQEGHFCSYQCRDEWRSCQTLKGDLA